MADNTKSRFSIETAIVIIGVVAIFIVIAIFRVAVTPPPPISKQTPTAIQPTASPSVGYQSEIIPPPAETLSPTQTPRIVVTNIPVSTQTLIVIPTLISNSQLPDLTVTAISNPICAQEYEGTKLRFTIFVRNIGPVSTRDFGAFDTDVFLILGQRKYSLEEWDAEFDGVIGSSVTEIFNLNPNGDIKFTVVIDLIGNKAFGIEVAANSGEKPIREADMTNNTLIKYFSAACY